MVEDKYVAEWEQALTSKDEVLQEAKRSLRRYRRAREGRSSSPEHRGEQEPLVRAVQHIPVEPTERERDMEDALRKYLAAHASRRPLVQRFRREDLPHGDLLKRDEDIALYLAAELDVEPDVKLYLTWSEPKPDVEVCFDVNYYGQEARDQENELSPSLVGWIAEQDKEQERLLEQDWEGPSGWHLEKLAEWLMDKYTWKHVEDVVVFLISGRPPRLVEPLRVTRYMNDNFSISFSSWVSEETVLRAYRATHPPYPRQPRDKTMRVFRFVLEQMDEEGRLPSWDKLLDRWNTANPSEAFSHRSALYKAYTRPARALSPPYLPLSLER